MKKVILWPLVIIEKSFPGLCGVRNQLRAPQYRNMTLLSFSWLWSIKKVVPSTASFLSDRSHPEKCSFIRENSDVEGLIWQWSSFSGKKKAWCLFFNTIKPHLKENSKCVASIKLGMRLADSWKTFSWLWIWSLCDRFKHLSCLLVTLLSVHSARCKQMDDSETSRSSGYIT